MSQSDNRLHLRSTKCFPAMFAKTGRGRRPRRPACPSKNRNPQGCGSPLPLIRKFYFAFRRRTSEPALCKGRCRAERGTGVVPDTNYLLFLFSKLQTFTIPQALARQLPLHKGAFSCLCEHRKKNPIFCRRQLPLLGGASCVCANIAGNTLHIAGGASSLSEGATCLS